MLRRTCIIGFTKDHARADYRIRELSNAALREVNMELCAEHQRRAANLRNWSRDTLRAANANHHAAPRRNVSRGR